jgi:alpha-L-fucosidase 2
LAWKVNFWARLHDGDHAWLLLKHLFHPVGVPQLGNSDGSGTYGNLFDSCPPFQIDGNFGATAGIAEMLVQFDEAKETVRLLPALPGAWAAEGSVSGLKVKGGASVDIAWKGGKIVKHRVYGPGSKSLRVVGPGL